MLTPRSALLACLALPLVAGCTVETAELAEPAPLPDPSTVAPVDASTLDPTNPIEDQRSLAFNEPDIPLVGGYRAVNDPCQRAGESRFTRRFLSDSSDLVACIRGGGAERALNAVAGVNAVAQTPSYTLFQVPKGAVKTATTG